MNYRTRPYRLRLVAVMIASTGAVFAPGSGSGAQQPTAAHRDAAQDSTKPRRLFMPRDAFIAAAFAAATIIAFPLDKQAAHELQNPNTQANRFFKNASTGVEVITSPGAYLIGGSLYAVGKLGRFERLADLGWHGTEAVLIGDAVTMLLKGTLGRARPFVSNDTNPGDWQFGGGFGNGDRKSFPSGHTTTAFSAASAVTAEVIRWYPKSTWIVAPAMYGGATLVGLSRMYHNRHWASDVALGAAIGTFSGRKVVDFAHRHPNNRLDQIMLGTTIVPTAGGGVAMLVSLPVP